MSAATVLLTAAPDTAAVRVWEGSTTIPTYAEGPANPNPPFDLFTFGRVNYLYPIRNRRSDYLVLQSALQSDPEDATARLLLGSRYLASGLTEPFMLPYRGLSHALARSASQGESR